MTWTRLHAPETDPQKSGETHLGKIGKVKQHRIRRNTRQLVLTCSAFGASSATNASFRYEVHTPLHPIMPPPPLSTDHPSVLSGRKIIQKENRNNIVVRENPQHKRRNTATASSSPRRRSITADTNPHRNRSDSPSVGASSHLLAPPSGRRRSNPLLDWERPNLKNYIKSRGIARHARGPWQTVSSCCQVSSASSSLAMLPQSVSTRVQTR